MKCKACKLTKNPSDFYVTNKTTCKKCVCYKAYIWHREHKDKVKVWNRQYKARNKEKVSAYFKKWYNKKQQIPSESW